MKVRIDLPQVFAKKVTHPRTAYDEAYVAYFVTLVKPGDNNDTLVRKFVAKKVSPIKYRIKNKTRWIPEDTTAIIDVGDAEAMFVTVAVYEYDDGKIYKDIKEKSDVLIEPEDFDWTSIEIPTNLTDWFSWIKSVWKVVVTSFNYFKQDDLLGVRSIDVPQLKDSSKRDWEGYRELKFKKYGGDYRVSLVMMVEEE